MQPVAMQVLFTYSLVPFLARLLIKLLLLGLLNIISIFHYLFDPAGSASIELSNGYKKSVVYAFIKRYIIFVLNNMFIVSSRYTNQSNNPA